MATWLLVFLLLTLTWGDWLTLPPASSLTTHTACTSKARCSLTWATRPGFNAVRALQVTYLPSSVCALGVGWRCWQVVAEVDSVVGPQRNPTLDDIRGMVYLRASLGESLRLYPQVAALRLH
jgi:hypothetical protein